MASFTDRLNRAVYFDPLGRLIISPETVSPLGLESRWPTMPPMPNVSEPQPQPGIPPIEVVPPGVNEPPPRPAPTWDDAYRGMPGGVPPIPPLGPLPLAPGANGPVPPPSRVGSYGPYGQPPIQPVTNVPRAGRGMPWAVQGLEYRGTTPDPMAPPAGPGAPPETARWQLPLGDPRSEIGIAGERPDDRRSALWGQTGAPAPLSPVSISALSAPDLHPDQPIIGDTVASELPRPGTRPEAPPRPVTQLGALGANTTARADSAEINADRLIADTAGPALGGAPRVSSAGIDANQLIADTAAGATTLPGGAGAGPVTTRPLADNLPPAPPLPADDEPPESAFLGINADGWRSIMQAGLAMIDAANEPGISFLGALGKGVGYGVEFYNEAKRQASELDNAALDRALELYDKGLYDIGDEVLRGTRYEGLADSERMAFQFAIEGMKDVYDDPRQRLAAAKVMAETGNFSQAIATVGAPVTHEGTELEWVRGEDGLERAFIVDRALGTQTPVWDFSANGQAVRAPDTEAGWRHVWATGENGTGVLWRVNVRDGSRELVRDDSGNPILDYPSVVRHTGSVSGDSRQLMDFVRIRALAEDFARVDAAKSNSFGETIDPDVYQERFQYHLDRLMGQFSMPGGALPAGTAEDEFSEDLGEAITPPPAAIRGLNPDNDPLGLSRFVP